MIDEELRYGNRTTYGIRSDGWRYAWGAYLIFVTISSLVGDSTILIASIKYKAIKLQRITIVIIQHIAVADLMVVLTDVMPKLISVITGRWVFGSLMCRVAPAPRIYFVAAGLYLVSTMTTTKMLLIKFPLRFRTFVMERENLICLGCWVGALVGPAVFLLSINRITYFSYRGYQCDFTDPSPSHGLKLAAPVLLVFTPALVVFATSSFILTEARRVAQRFRDDMKWQGAMATIMTAFLYLLSVFPHLLYRVVERISSEENSSFMLKQFYRIAISFHYFNTISNFYIYCLTVASFRNFIMSRIRWRRTSVSRVTFRGKEQLLSNLS